MYAFHDNKKYCFKSEKRKFKRVDFSCEIYFPHINSIKSITDKLPDKPILEAMNLSEDGICFKSSVPFKRNDFISILLRIENNPSFECLTKVTWVGFDDKSYIVGCQFCSLKLHEILEIRTYVKNH